MTMICVNARHDRAEIMSDNFYTGRHGLIARPGVKPRVSPLRAIDAAVTFRGTVGTIPSGGGLAWLCAAAKLSLEEDDFDGFVDGMQEALRTWGSEGLCAYAFGYSPRHGRMKAYVAWVGDDFAPQDISDEMHVTPAPDGVRPTDVERRRDEMSGKPPAPPGGEPLKPPMSVEGWVELAKRCHRNRACAPITSGRKLIVGGPVTLTRLVRGSVTQDTIHTFDADDMRAMLVGTLHPFGQVGPCECGSGRRFLDCCLPPVFHLPCLCESGKRLKDCCLLGKEDVRRLLDEHPELRDLAAPDLRVRGATVVTDEMRAAAAEAGVEIDAMTGKVQTARGGKVERNAACPCGSGSKYKKCCALVAA